MNCDPVLLKSSAIDRAREILVRAFKEDPMFTYLGIKAKSGQSKVDTDTLKWFCKFNLRNCQQDHHIYTTSDNFKGVAAWI